MNLIDIYKQFATEEDCLAYLESQRWPNGVRCVTCGTDRVTKVKSSSKKQTVRYVYQCNEPSCRQQFTAKSGTIFHDSHLPLQKWFAAIALIGNAKKGLSAKQLERDLGVNYRTAWHMAHRIRKSMVEEFPLKLKGTVEIDETYIGGKARIRGRKRSKVEKDMVLGMIERGGRLRYFHVPNAKKDTIKPLLDRHIAVMAKEIHTDQAVVYDFAIDKDFRAKHKTVNHSQTYVSADGAHTNTIESAFSLLKRGLIGSFHRVTIKHLHRYLSEFEYRFNNRKNPEMFADTVRRMTKSGALQYKALTAENPATAL